MNFRSRTLNKLTEPSCVKFFNDAKKVANDMRIQLVAITVLAALLASLFVVGEAAAQKQSKNEVKTIMETYRKAVAKAQSDFTAAVKKANEDARAAVSKGLPIDQINADSKATIQKARVDLKAAIDKAKNDAKTALERLKATASSKVPK